MRKEKGERTLGGHISVVQCFSLGGVQIRKMVVKRVTSDTVAHYSIFHLFVVIVVLP